MPNFAIKYQPLRNDALRKARAFLSSREYLQLEKQTLQGMMAIYDEDVVAVALFQIYKPRLVLQRLFVDPRFRRFGIGTGMMETLGKLADSLQLDYLFSFEGSGLQDPFYRFLASTRLFSIERQEGYTVVLSKEDIKPLYEKYAKQKIQPTYYFDLPAGTQGEFLARLKRAYPDIAQELSEFPQSYRKDLCCCGISNGQIQGICLFKEEDYELELKLLYSTPGKGVAATKALIHALGQLDVNHLLPVRITPIGNAATNLLEHLCPSRKIEHYVYTAYYMGKR